MNGGDDLLRVDPLEVGAGGREVRVPGLALDQRQWDPFIEHSTAWAWRSWCLCRRRHKPPRKFTPKFGVHDVERRGLL